jgi:hypothetical protein
MERRAAQTPDWPTVIRAPMAFFDAGGTTKDVDRPRYSAACVTLFGELLIPLPRIRSAVGRIACLDGADVDLTGRTAGRCPRSHIPTIIRPNGELAHRVTQGLLALKPSSAPSAEAEAGPAARALGTKAEVELLSKSLPLRYPARTR